MAKERAPSSPIDSDQHKASFNEFCRSSTIHGLSAISNSQKKISKLMWALSFITACVLFFWQVSKLAGKLASHEITTKTTTRSLTEVEFPVVTICNSQPYSESKIKKYLNATKGEMESSLSTVARNTLFAKRIGEMTFDELEKLSPGMESFGLSKLTQSCQFAERKCTEDMSLITVPILGNCIVFNKNMTLKQRRLGPDFGFSAFFDINEDDYAKISFLENAGSGVLLHLGNSRNGIPEYYSLQNAAIRAAPGMLTQIKLKRLEKQRLPHPYVDSCREELRLTELHGVVFKTELRYSVEWCKTICLWKWQMKSCGFVAPYYKAMIDFKIDKKKSNISFSNAKENDELENERKCLKDSLMNGAGDDNCICQPSCYDVEYGISISHLKWPSPNGADILLNEMNELSPNDPTFQNWTKERIFKNLVKVEIYFDDFQVVKIEQIPTYDWIDLLSDFGGQAGLWIGASVYSIFELFSFLVSYFLQILLKMKRRKNIMTSDA